MRIINKFLIITLIMILCLSVFTCTYASTHICTHDCQKYKIIKVCTEDKSYPNVGTATVCWRIVTPREYYCSICNKYLGPASPLIENKPHANSDKIYDAWNDGNYVYERVYCRQCGYEFRLTRCPYDGHNVPL